MRKAALILIECGFFVPQSLVMQQLGMGRFAKNCSLCVVLFVKKPVCIDLNYYCQTMLRTLYIVCLITALSCQKKPGREASTGGSSPEDSAAVLAKRPGPDAPRSAADRLVRALYFEHSKKANPLLETKDRTLIDQFFIKSTADLIWRTTSASPEKLRQMKSNPLFNAPTSAIKKMWVEPAAVAGTRAVVYVTFEHKAKPEEIRIDMQEIAGRWRIIDMLYPDGSRLTQILEKKS